MDYTKFDAVKEDGTGVRDKESSGANKKAAWCVLVEKKDLARLREMLDRGELDLACTWSGERQRWTTAGNFQDEREEGTYSPLGYAVAWNKPEVVELFLERGADPAAMQVVNKVSRTPMSIALGRGHKKCAQLLKAKLPPSSNNAAPPPTTIK